MPWDSSFEGEEKEENRGKVCMEKIVGWLGCSTQFSLVTQKAQVQKSRLTAHWLCYSEQTARALYTSASSSVKCENTSLPHDFIVSIKDHVSGVLCMQYAYYPVC